MSEQPLPYRTTLRADLPGEISATDSAAVLRLLRGRLDGRPLDDALRTLEDHSSELLRTLAFTNGITGDRFSSNTAAATAVARAQQEALQEGVVWTPVLDLLATSGAFARLERVTPPHPSAVPATDWVRRLEPWIAGVSSEAALDLAEAFRSPTLRQLVVERMVLPAPTPDDLVPAPAPDLPPALGPAPGTGAGAAAAGRGAGAPGGASVPPGQAGAGAAEPAGESAGLASTQRGALLARAMRLDANAVRWIHRNPGLVAPESDRLVAGAYGRAVRVASTDQTRREEVLADARARWGELRPAVQAIVARVVHASMGRKPMRGEDIPHSEREHVARLAGVLLDAPALERGVLDGILGASYVSAALRVRALLHPALPEAERETVLNGVPEAVRLREELLRERLGTTAMIAPLAEGALSELTIKGVLAHPASTPDLWRQVFRQADTSSQRMREALAASRASSLPEVRRALETSESVPVLAGLLRTAPAPEWPVLFHRVLRRAPSTALQVLAETSLPEGTEIPAGWLRQFLTHEERGTRALALQCLAKCRGGAEPPPVRRPRVRQS